MSLPNVSATTDTQPWFAAYLAPKCKQPKGMSREELLAILKEDPDAVGRGIVLVDLRKADHEGGTIRGSINLPAQSLYPALPTLYGLFKAAGARKVVFYCGSSRGRGTRAAGWLTDHIENQGDTTMESLVLLDGVRGWAAGGPEFVKFMEGYDQSAWA
ncbi:Rhodanese-like domain-containing protein [Pseudomassariella vexata]|uniref:Rhodanese-like domain-containing protein n=1 Tax=Pseudomassariella vexata TaxID=1141098 RepID=A0A1Y2D622_9PEZI|nr:Rhodanese-like domain-containing protein [Pseudomassariella vexata]ORY54700.1 Rhodanese-like domain-containing protein [Pseudomassariella vexata]